LRRPRPVTYAALEEDLRRPRPVTCLRFQGGASAPSLPLCHSRPYSLQANITELGHGGLE
jgi:hypothetical protein